MPTQKRTFLAGLPPRQFATFGFACSESCGCKGAGSVVGISNKNEHCNPKRYMMTNQRSNQDADAIVILRMKKAAWIDNEQFKSSIGTDQMKKMQSRWARWSNQQVAPKCISNEREPDMATITLVFQQDNAPPKDKEGLQVTIKKLD
ncbi:hypothetical protein L3Y34_011145 [Caenorhabditis briggsae]|uniref:Uncharacterized protein n=1 Tax=Caenorhabditis briggsae TaxID=6238 RepID=A0AAE9CTL7_CAEBR|nr:hypothetical protein L3Y34_011145 [Caenorhabditis briggsae]